MTATGAGSRLREALDLVLVPAGFTAGQGGDDGGQVIWCAAHDELSAAHPRLPQAYAQSAGGACIDLVADIGDDGALERLDLEALSLSDTLRGLGLEREAGAVAAVLGHPVDDTLPVLVDSLETLLGSRG